MVLNVYDVAGRLMETLIDGEVKAGQHSVAFDGRGLSTGIYFIRLECEAGKFMTRALLIR